MRAYLINQTEQTITEVNLMEGRDHRDIERIAGGTVMKRIAIVLASAVLLTTFNSPANAWTCHPVSGWALEGRPHRISSIDLNRSPDGQWTVVHQWTMGQTTKLRGWVITTLIDNPDPNVIAQWTNRIPDKAQDWSGVLATGKVYFKNNVLTYTTMGFDAKGNQTFQLDAECDDDKIS